MSVKTVLKDEADKVAGLFKSLFKGTRPGLDKFLTKYKGQAFKLVQEVGVDFVGQPLSSWKEIAFSQVKADLGNKAPSDTALSIITELAQDMFKAKQDSQAPAGSSQ